MKSTIHSHSTVGSLSHSENKPRLSTSSKSSSRSKSPMIKQHQTHHNAVVPKASTSPSLSDMDMESILRDLLFKLKMMTLKIGSADMKHDHDNIDQFIKQRAQHDVTSSVNHHLSKLESLRGPSDTHKVTAYAQTSYEILQSLESCYQRDSGNNQRNYQRVDDDQQQQQQLTSSSLSISSLTKELAIKEQMIAKIISEKSMLETALFKAVHHHDDMKLQLEDALIQQAKANQRLIELQLRCLDFKSEVDNHVESIKQSCTSRLGYVPSTTMQHVSYIHLLHPPCSDYYDASRIQALVDHQHRRHHQVHHDTSLSSLRSLRSSLSLKKKKTHHRRQHHHVYDETLSSSIASWLPVQHDERSNPWADVVHLGDRTTELLHGDDFHHLHDHEENGHHYDVAEDESKHVDKSESTLSSSWMSKPVSAPSKLLHMIATRYSYS